jgi:ferredoxin
MPKIDFDGKVYTCEMGANLRQFLLSQGASPYNGPAKAINCLGLGTCGTCAVGIRGEVSQLSGMEKFRLNFPPHKGSDGGRRLACQVQVLGDIEVSKYEGFWGEGATQNPQTTAQ